jgi:hypothetical protein
MSSVQYGFIAQKLIDFNTHLLKLTIPYDNLIDDMSLQQFQLMD